MSPQDQTPHPSDIQARQQAAAAAIARSHVDQIYQEASPTTAAQAQPQHHAITPEQWQHYHSAWQDYYQQYYERYYAGHLQQARAAMASQLHTTPPIEMKAEALSHDEALNELRGKLRTTIEEKATRVRNSRHFVPITAGLSVALVFGFLQYNQLLMANVQAYVSPGNIKPQNIIVDPTLSTKVDSSLTNLIIPKINVDVPVDYSAKPDYDSQMAAMEHGVAYFGVPGANSKPGQAGNTPIAGHSSNDVFASGAYKFIFAQLERVEKGDTVYANYKGTRYTYVVTKIEVVLPTDVSKLAKKTDTPTLTLITCTPLGTAQKRLLVTAEQVNPDPDRATAAPTTTDKSEAVSIPGTQPTLLERLFGRR